MTQKKEESKSAELYRKAAEQGDAKTLNDLIKRNGLTEYILSDLVTEIGASAFEGCSALTSIIIPDSVTKIGVDAFRGCGLTRR